MALIPRRNPLTSLLNFAADRDREANSIGSVITKLAGPALGQLGVQTEEQPQPAVMRGPAPQAQQLGPMTGPAVAPTPVMSDAELKANVFPGESGGDYNALYGYANRPGQPFEGVNLTDMTVNEVIDFTDPSGPYGQWVRSTPSFQKTDAYKRGLTATPTGAFQVVGTTLKDAVKGLGLTGDEPYNEATQDAIGRWIFENQGPKAWEAWGKSGGTVSAGGGDARLGGGTGADTMGGNSVEGILAQLYPQMSPEDEKRQRRKDLFAAASQGFSALSQGRPIDFSNIRQAQEQRRTQAVQDMRERERARAAASLVLDQGGSPAMATALVTGAASMGDFLTDRQLRKAQETADKQKLLDIQRTELLVPVLKSAGFSDARIAEMVEYGKGGGDLTELMTFEQTSAAAEKAREAEVVQDELAQEYLASDDPQLRTLGRLIQSGLPLKDAIDSATKLVPAAGGTKEFADLAEAQAIVDSGAINPNTGKPFANVGEVRAADLFRPTAATAAQPMVRINPDNTVTIIPAAPAAPVAAATAPAAPAAGGAPAVGAPLGVSGAFSQQLGNVETGIPAAPAAPAFVPSGGVYAQGGGITATAPLAAGPAFSGQALPLDVAQSATDLEKTGAQTTDIRAQTQVRLQELSQAIAEAPDQLTKLGLENEELQLRIAEAQARTDVAPEVQKATLANLQADLAKKQTELATLEADAAKQQTAEYANASRSFAVFENAAKSALTKVDNAWTTGTYGKIAMSFLPDNFATARSSFLEDLRQMGSQAMLDALAEAKAAGVTLTPVSNLDSSALGASQSKLSNPERLEGEDIRKEVVFQLNFAKDAIVGPKDLNRVDEFGKTYKTTQDTLGLTEDTFARHWREIPPAVAEAWRNGELDALPTDDPLYAEAADVLNQQINNWQTYQGDLDRATVGVLPTPPEGIAPEEWPDVWLELSVGERAAYRKQAKKGNQ
jgi:hypothetical protein